MNPWNFKVSKAGASCQFMYLFTSRQPFLSALSLHTIWISHFSNLCLLITISLEVSIFTLSHCLCSKYFLILFILFMKSRNILLRFTLCKDWIMNHRVKLVSKDLLYYFTNHYIIQWLMDWYGVKINLELSYFSREWRILYLYIYIFGVIVLPEIF